MSNTTDTPRNSGGQRRRRQRGGKNRNNKQNQNQNQGQPNRSQGNKGGGRKRRRPRRKHIPLSWWQKALIAIGLYQDPNKRNAKKSAKQSGQKPKSNTRNARTGDNEKRTKADPTNKRAERDKKRRGGDPSTVQSNRVYVGNLSYDTTEQDLKELFKGVGTVRAVEIVYNLNTHRSKGYGFVDMMNKEDAMRCVEVFHDQPFMGRNMTVSGAKKKGEGDDDDNEPAMEIKAADVKLAPLPEKSESEPQEQPATEAQSAPEPPADTPQQATSDAPASGEKREQD